MIQDIEPYQYDNHYYQIQPKSTSYVVLIRNNSVLIRKSGIEIEFPTVGELKKHNKKFTYLFSIDHSSFFTILEEDLSNEILLQKKGKYQFINIFDIHLKKPKWKSFAVASASQLIGWYKRNQICGCCGHPMEQNSAERKLQCNHCGNQIYPQICPAIVVGIIHNDSILMTRYADQRDGIRYALIAGFAEIGETIEETVQREVMEEVGLKVKNLKYYKSQPWSFSDTLLLGFFCNLDGTDKIKMDRNELSTAKWVKRDEMNIEDDGISLTYEMMAAFKNGFIPVN